MQAILFSLQSLEDLILMQMQDLARENSSMVFSLKKTLPRDLLPRWKSQLKSQIKPDLLQVAVKQHLWLEPKDQLPLSKQETEAHFQASKIW